MNFIPIIYSTIQRRGESVGEGGRRGETWKWESFCVRMNWYGIWCWGDDEDEKEGSEDGMMMMGWRSRWNDVML